MGNELSILEKESRLDELHRKSLEVCYSLMEGKNLKKALLDNGITARNFFDQKRIHQDIKKAYSDAEEVRAELKMAELDELSDDLLMENDLNKDTYMAVSNNIKWSITKLLPDRYGNRPNVQNASYTQNNINLMSTLTDEQLLSIVNGGSLDALPPVMEKENNNNNNNEIIDMEIKKGVDNSNEIEYNSAVEEKNDIHTLIRPFTQNIASTSGGSVDKEQKKNFSFGYKTGKKEPPENPPKKRADSQAKTKSIHPTETKQETLPETKQENRTSQPAEFDLSIFSGIG